MCFMFAGQVEFNHMFCCKICVVLALCLMSLKVFKDGSEALGAFLPMERNGVLSAKA